MSIMLKNPPTACRSSLRNWIVNHGIILFFLGTFVLTWTVYGLVAIVHLENKDTVSIMLLIAAYAPTISALVLSAITNPEVRRVSTANTLILCFLVLILAAGIEVMDHIFWDHQIDLGLVLASAIMVTIAALVMTRLLTNRADAHLRFTGVVQWRFWVWVPFALGLWPLLVVTANTIARVFGLPVPANPIPPDVTFPVLLIESFFWALLFGGGLNEEAGWRGFALPRLQTQFSPLIASIIIGAFWGLWHVPLHVMEVGIYGGNPWGALIRIMDIPRAILFTWLYNRTKGSLLVAMLFHAAINTTSYFMSRSHVVVFALVFLVGIFLVIIDKMWHKLHSSHQTSQRFSKPVISNSRNAPSNMPPSDYI
jgi:membrane protease YdiL (CAAX protease family)